MNWKDEFDKEFTFTGIGHQLEGLALEEELKAFISNQFEKLIEEIPEKQEYGEDHDFRDNISLKQQLKAKWLGGKNELQK